ncbi:MAG: DNA oxidative demethylase AlkB [Rhodocyclaceae bacterium]|nr:DNA oxidative demethylase AlkB [Rhodocyclaceae bacterium]
MAAETPPLSTPDLFRSLPDTPDLLPLAAGAAVLPGFVDEASAATCLVALRGVLNDAPLRHMVTPGGHRMTVAMSNCGPWGWTSSKTGYRYSRTDPESGRPWPAIPPVLRDIAERAAARVGFDTFHPDACLINRYRPGAKLSPHQDRDERALDQPIVSLSLGLPATFQFGGPARRTRLQRTVLESGDVVVWGGPSRLAYHGVLPLAEGRHPLTGACRINLSFRQV